VPTIAWVATTRLANERRVLVVDDEEFLQDIVATGLRFVGFDVRAVGCARDAFDALSAYRPDIVLLDVLMPDLDGFEVLRRMRSDGHRMPVVMLTARDATEDKLQGLRLGADDYLTKPFSLEELVLRLEAILRRIDGSAQGIRRLTVGEVTLDDDVHDVWCNDLPIEFSPTEYNLLRFLMVNAGRVVSRDQIVANVWGAEFSPESNVVDTYISYIRKKLDPVASKSLIRTVRGVGYTMPVASQR
jgi:two-component system OmpR family response regulator